MSIEPLYQPDKAAKSASKSALLLLSLINVLRILSYVFLVVFVISLLTSLSALLGIEPLRSELFDDVSLPATLVASVTIIIGTLAFLVVLKQLRQICLTLYSGDPFVPENAGRLRIIWIAVAFAEVLRLLTAVVISWFHNRGQSGDTELVLDLRIYVWFLVLALIVLSEVFAEGARLRQEQKLTI